jgi:hypothetical protein
MQNSNKSQVRSLATLFMVAIGTVASFAQGVVSVTSPASIAGPKAYTTPVFWNIDTMASRVCSDLVLAGGLGNNDSLAGVPLTNAAAVSGKIVVIYRGTFNLNVKINNAAAAGAIGVILVQRDGTPPPASGGWGGGTINTPIPSVMIYKADGDAIVAAMRAGQTVNLCMGKTNLQNNLKLVTFAPSYSAYASLFTQTDSLLNITGGEVFNLGLSDQHNLVLHTTVTNTNTSFVNFNNTYTGTDTCSTIDTPADTLLITNGGVSLRDNGIYNFNSTIAAMEAEDFPVDNTSTRTCNINDFYISKVPVNPNTFQPSFSTAYTVSNTADPHPGVEVGFVFDAKFNPSSTIGLDTVKFSAAGQVDLSGKIVSVALYEVLDTDGTGTVETDAERNLIAVKDYTFPALTGTAKTAITQAALGFDLVDGALLTNGTRYLITVTAPSTPATDKVYIGFSSVIDYEGVINAFWNNANLKPKTPFNTYLYNPGTSAHGRSGFGFGLSPSIAVRVKVYTGTTRSEELNNKVGVFPNPTSGLVRVDLSKFNSASSVVVTNLLGTTVASYTNQTGILSIDLSAQASGMYIISVRNADGQAVKKVSLTK